MVPRIKLCDLLVELQVMHSSRGDRAEDLAPRKTMVQLGGMRCRRSESVLRVGIPSRFAPRPQFIWKYADRYELTITSRK
jgi:hypothetical protein